MQLSNVCRLCLKEENLIWVFDKRFENRGMRDVVLITTGVEISTSDTISQKICGKCSELTIRMFEFRKTSQRSDGYLKERSKQYLKTNNLDNLPTDVTIKKEKIEEPEHPETKPRAKEEVKPKTTKRRLHPSIRELYEKYSGIRLPDVCLSSDYAPVVSLPMHRVERYFKRRNLDFGSHVKAALKPPKRVATKRTSASNKPKPKSHKSHNTDDNRQVDVKRDNSTNKISIKFLKNNDGHESAAGSSGTDKDHVVKPKTSRKLETESEPIQKKRKISEVEKSDDKVTKPAFVESLGLITKPGATEDPAYVANVSTPLHICQICSSVQYNAKDLRKHKNKHLRCQFCKARFRSQETKEEHISKSCRIKNAMNNLPDVMLERIEDSQEIRMKYPDAFSQFPVLNNNVITLNNKENGNLVVNPKRETVHPENVEKSKVLTASPIDIIEIDSDEEDLAPPATDSKNSPATNSVGDNIPQDNSNENNPNLQSSPSTPQRLLPIPENVVYNTVSIVKPDVRINNNYPYNYVLDNLDSKTSDVKLLKQVLASSKQMLWTTDQSNQTDPPSNDSIVLNEDTVELKNLKQQLYSYKIPVSIKMGSQINVFYDSTVKEQRSRKLHLWRNLTPIDVTNKNLNVHKSASETIVRESEKQGSDVNNIRTVSVAPPAASYNNSSAALSLGSNTSSNTANAPTLLPLTSSYITHFTNNPSVKSYPSAKPNIPSTITSASTFNPVSSNTTLHQPTVTVNIPATFSLVRTATAPPLYSVNNASSNMLLNNSCLVPSVQPQTSLNNVSNVLFGNGFAVPTSVQAHSSLTNTSNNMLLDNSHIVPTVQSHSTLRNVPNNVLLGTSCMVPTSAQSRLSLSNVSNSVLLGNNFVVSTSVQPSNNTPNNIQLGNCRVGPTPSQPRVSLNNASNSTLVSSTPGNSCIIPSLDAMVNNFIDRELSRETSNPTLQPALPVRQSNPNLRNMSNTNPALPLNPPSVTYAHSFDASGASSSSSTNHLLPNPAPVPSSSTITVGTIRVKNVWELT